MVRLAMLFRFTAPIAANWRMKNLFELTPFPGRRKDNGAKCAPIQLSIFIKNWIPKRLTDFGKNILILTGKLARHHIGIKKRGVWQQLAQAIYKGRFTGGNTARNSDCRHAAKVAQTSRLW